MSQDPSAIVDQLQALYTEAAGSLRSALGAYLQEGVRPDSETRANGTFAYPELRIGYAGDRPPSRIARA